jgi:hypothetical protein
VIGHGRPARRRAYAAGVADSADADVDLAGGLCDGCRYARLIGSRRGSRFLLCERSRLEPYYAKYPRLPVLRCAGFRPRPAEAEPGQAPPGG